MIVQEAGMAVGWPLGLGHDTTGWPLGLRLRLTQEDLQWPREPHLDDSPTYSSNSSSLDTESTRSFFQDKSISLGTLIGLPINSYPAANQQGQRRRRTSSGMLRVFPTSTSSGSGDCNPPLRNKSRNSNRSSSHGSNRIPTKTSVSTGWTILSVLSCAKVPTGSAESDRSSKSSTKSRSREHSHAGSEHSQSQPLPPATTGGGENNNHSSAAGGGDSHQRGLQQFISRSPPANKLYDNITFEEEATDHDDSHSSEWNPLFASSSLEAVDDLEEAPDVVPESLEHMKQSLMMRSSSTYSDSLASDWSSASESVDVRRSPRDDLSHQLGKQSAISMLISRMVEEEMGAVEYAKICRHDSPLASRNLFISGTELDFSIFSTGGRGAQVMAVLLISTND